MNEEGLEFLNQKIVDGKIDVIKATIFTIALPIIFVMFKSNFFSNVIKPQFLFSSIVVFIFGCYAFIYRTYKKNSAIGLFVKEFSFSDNKELKIETLGEKSFSCLLSELKLMDGYKGGGKMTDVFGEPTFRLENPNGRVIGYMISTHWNQWGKLRDTFSNKNNL
ncbi:hypothetical protein [Pedobacter endophyticus]|nr:hypothetical protein [Pedobacter endophyticus]